MKKIEKLRERKNKVVNGEKGRGGGRGVSRPLGRSQLYVLSVGGGGGKYNSIENAKKGNRGVLPETVKE